MQRWIIAGALVLFLLGGGGLFAVWKIRQQRPDHQYIPMAYNPTSTPEERARTEKEMRERLVTDAVLTGVVRDCNIVSKWNLPSESAAVQELRDRMIFGTDFDDIQGVKTECLRIGFRGVVSEHKDLEALSKRMMDDVQRILRNDQPGAGSAAPAGVGAGGAAKF